MTTNTPPIRFLDIDLDTFIEGIAHWPEGGRLDPDDHPPWSKNRLRKFLEGSCGLSKTSRIPGRLVDNHDEAFDYLRGLFLQHGQMDLVHVDAHADLGMGDGSWVHMMDVNLRRTPKQRMRPKRGRGGMNLGSWLAYVVAARWLSRLTYVHPEHGGDDLPALWFPLGDVNSSVIQMKVVNRENMPRMGSMLDYEKLCAMQGDAVEPAIPFEQFTIDKYTNSMPFHFALLCRSPDYTPEISDELISVFEDYISFENDTAFYKRTNPTPPSAQI